MTQNKGKLIDLFIGNASNAILHRILENAILKLNQLDIAGRYRKEIINSYEIAKRYREKINPIFSPLPSSDTAQIKSVLLRRIRSEINIRIEKGYKNLDLASAEQEIDDFLKEMRVIA
jgi:hypothetical protein